MKWKSTLNWWSKFIFFSAFGVKSDSDTSEKWRSHKMKKVKLLVFQECRVDHMMEIYLILWTVI